MHEQTSILSSVFSVLCEAAFHHIHIALHMHMYKVSNCLSSPFLCFSKLAVAVDHCALAFRYVTYHHIPASILKEKHLQGYLWGLIPLVRK